MTEISEKSLTEYLNNIRDLEASCYKQQLYIANLNELFRKANTPRLYAQKKYVNAKEGPGVMPFIYACSSIGMPIGIVYCFLTSDGFFNKIITALFGGTLGGFLIGALIGAILGIVVEIIYSIKQKHTICQINAGIDLENRQIAERNNLIKDDAVRKANAISMEINRARNVYSQTKKVLDEYYAHGIVYEKYRGLVPITMFCEYLSSGRCSTLIGHEGAYNIYENEIRLNLIITKLDDIILKLDEIRDNQYMLAGLIREGNREVQNLTNAVANQTDKLQEIEKNTLVSAYYDKITANNTMYLSWIAYKNFG